jgi:hypothetical protein
MIRRTAAVLVWCALLLSPVVAVARLLSTNISVEDWNVLVEHGIITSNLIQCVSICVVLFAWALSVITLIQGIRLRRSAWHVADPSSLLSVCGIALAGFLTMGSQGTSHDNASSGIDVRALVSPVMAGLATAHAVRKLQNLNVSTSTEPVSHISPPDMPMHRGVAVFVDRGISDPEWKIVVRVYGYPRVETCLGEVGEFRKRKALELLAWLSINRDRPLRSAARTAMWETNISDSSFATVVSDMRRSLSELCSDIAPREWAPPTFTDEIVLSELVVTDVQLLARAWEQFQCDQTCIDVVVSELSKIRDLPFAGTNYQWPDVDGTTTRLIIFGAQVAREVAYVAYDNKNWAEVTTAVTAGLRLLPGDEELLDLQKLVLQSSYEGLK